MCVYDSQAEVIRQKIGFGDKLLKCSEPIPSSVK